MVELKAAAERLATCCMCKGLKHVCNKCAYHVDAMTCDHRRRAEDVNSVVCGTLINLIEREDDRK